MQATTCFYVVKYNM